MPKAIYKCKNCSKEVTIDFTVGKAPTTPVCDKCKEEMVRTFKKTEVLSSVNHDMIDLGQKMLLL